MGVKSIVAVKQKGQCEKQGGDGTGLGGVSEQSQGSEESAITVKTLSSIGEGDKIFV